MPKLRDSQKEAIEFRRKEGLIPVISMAGYSPSTSQHQNDILISYDDHMYIQI